MLTMVTFWDMQKRLRGHQDKPTHAFPSIFFEKILGEKMKPPRKSYCPKTSYQLVKKYGRRVRSTKGDIFKLKTLLIPVNRNGACMGDGCFFLLCLITTLTPYANRLHVDQHWSLIVISFEERKIRYFDSMGWHGTRYLEGTKEYLKDEAKRLKRTDVNSTIGRWSIASRTIRDRTTGPTAACFCFLPRFSPPTTTP